jgi:hypothetical protein
MIYKAYITSKWLMYLVTYLLLLRPSSLVAVGMWGNTLLLHGELKLRLSQNLRSMMPEPPSKSLNRREYREAEEEILVSIRPTLVQID